MSILGILFGGRPRRLNNLNKNHLRLPFFTQSTRNDTVLDFLFTGGSTGFGWGAGRPEDSHGVPVLRDRTHSCRRYRGKGQSRWGRIADGGPKKGHDTRRQRPLPPCTLPLHLLQRPSDRSSARVPVRASLRAVWAGPTSSLDPSVPLGLWVHLRSYAPGLRNSESPLNLTSFSLCV